MKTADIPGFKIGDVKDSNVTVGHCNRGVANSRRRMSADPEPDWTYISDPDYAETPWDYTYKIQLRRQLYAIILEERRILRREDPIIWHDLTGDNVKVEWGNAKEVKTVDVHRTVDLKIFLNIDGEGDWIKLHHSIKLPKNAKLEGMKYTISDGVLTLIVPKDAKHAEAIDKGDRKRKHKAVDVVDPSMEEGGVDEHSRS